jgi:hypothetical protein
VDQDEIELRLQRALQSANLLKVAEEVPDDDDDGETLTTEDAIPSAVRPEAPRSQSLFQLHEAHPYVLDLFLLKRYGPEWLEWEPETLIARVGHDWRSGISPLNMQKLQAVKTLHFVDTFWQNWEVFTPCTTAFNNAMPDFEVMQIPTVAQCAVAVDIANRLRSEVSWSDEMKAYLEVVHKFDGVLCSIEPLEFVQIDVDAIDFDCGEVMRQWPSVRRTMQAPSDKTVTGEQLRRLLVVHETLLESRAALTTQLQLLLHA